LDRFDAKGLDGRPGAGAGLDETFPRIGTAVLECVNHRRATAIICGEMVCARFHLSECEALARAIIDVSARLGEAMQQCLKIKLPHIAEGCLLDKFARFVELAVGCEEQLMRDECRELYDGNTSAIIVQILRWFNDLSPIDAVKAREMSDQDFVPTFLEQFAMRMRQCETVVAKEHKRMFKNSSTDNGPCQATDNRADAHRKISAASVGHLCRFQMKKNNRLSENKKRHSRVTTGPSR
jgi:hypothetical protein